MGKTPNGKVWFRDLRVGAQFDFIGPTFASFFDRCEKISTRKYKSISTGTEYTVGSINVCVYHVDNTGGKAMLKLMTRHDTEVGEGSYDSIAWIYETILHEPDPGTFHAAVVHGNEDAPERVELYAAASPMVGEVPGRVWVSIDSFIETVNAKLREYYQTQFPNLQPAQVRADTGPKFHKIVKFDNSGHASAYCFVERKTGNIYKAAGWSAPAKGVRGNISDPWKALDPYGAKSLR